MPQKQNKNNYGEKMTDNDFLNNATSGCGLYNPYYKPEKVNFDELPQEPRPLEKAWKEYCEARGLISEVYEDDETLGFEARDDNGKLIDSDYITI
jgi:hypothetical protein